MNIQQCTTVIGNLQNDFDSHDFILKFLEKYPVEYGKLLIKYKNVNTAHAEIGRFLLDNSEQYLNHLKIEYKGEHESLNIFGNMSPCAKWHKK